MKRANRFWWLGGIAIAVVAILTLIAAPNTSYIDNGSTYNRAPDGYGAWYAYMQKQGVKIKRWQKPIEEIKANSITLVRVNSQLTSPELGFDEEKWVKQGNTLVILGVRGAATAADFSTLQESPLGNIKIETSRRYKGTELNVELGDLLGAVVWSKKVGKGLAIFSTTPYIAANAYQDYPNNFKYLAQLVSKNPQIFIDEYSHGYKDKSTTGSSQGDRNWLGYLAKTLLKPLLLQAGVLLMVLIWAQNRRFGAPASIEAPAIDNNIAYIQALAGVLEKAQCSEFILNIVSKEEQLRLQQSLGLGKIPLDRQTLVDNWVQQTKLSSTQLQQLLSQVSPHRLSDKQLLEWLDKWQKIRDRTSS